MIRGPCLYNPTTYFSGALSPLADCRPPSLSWTKGAWNQRAGTHLSFGRQVIDSTLRSGGILLYSFPTGQLIVFLAASSLKGPGLKSFSSAEKLVFQFNPQKGFLLFSRTAAYFDKEIRPFSKFSFLIKLEYKVKKLSTGIYCKKCGAEEIFQRRVFIGFGNHRQCRWRYPVKKL